MFGSFLPGLGWLAPPKSTRAREPTLLWNQLQALRWPVSLLRRSLCRANEYLQNLLGQVAGVHVFHVGEHDDSCLLGGRDRERGACALLAKPDPPTTLEGR